MGSQTRTATFGDDPSTKREKKAGDTGRRESGDWTSPEHLEEGVGSQAPAMPDYVPSPNQHEGFLGPANKSPSASAFQYGSISCNQMIHVSTPSLLPPSPSFTT